MVPFWFQLFFLTWESDPSLHQLINDADYRVLLRKIWWPLQHLQRRSISFSFFAEQLMSGFYDHFRFTLSLKKADSSPHSHHPLPHANTSVCAALWGSDWDGLKVTQQKMLPVLLHEASVGHSAELGMSAWEPEVNSIVLRASAATFWAQGVKKSNESTVVMWQMTDVLHVKRRKKLHSFWILLLSVSETAWKWEKWMAKRLAALLAFWFV